jgi:hypothetical protein
LSSAAASAGSTATDDVVPVARADVTIAVPDTRTTVLFAAALVIADGVVPRTAVLDVGALAALKAATGPANAAAGGAEDAEFVAFMAAAGAATADVAGAAPTAFKAGIATAAAAFAEVVPVTVNAPAGRLATAPTGRPAADSVLVDGADEVTAERAAADVEAKLGRVTATPSARFFTAVWAIAGCAPKPATTPAATKQANVRMNAFPFKKITP